MARRRSRRGRAADGSPPAKYADSEGNVVALRTRLSPSTRAEYLDIAARGASTIDDAGARRREFLFERLTVSWAIAELEPLTRQKELLGRYRMASGPERDWVDATIRSHVAEHFPELGP